MAEQGKGATRVTVACKLPHGLTMRLFKMEPFVEPVVGGGTRESKMPVVVGEPVTLKGYRALPFGVVPKAQIAGGYAITTGVDKDFFEEWMRQNKDSDIVKNKLVFAHVARESVEDFGRENEKRVNGLEPLDPDKLPSLSKNPKLKLETAEKD